MSAFRARIAPCCARTKKFNCPNVTFRLWACKGTFWKRNMLPYEPKLSGVPNEVRASDPNDRVRRLSGHPDRSPDDLESTMGTERATSDSQRVGGCPRRRG